MAAGAVGAGGGQSLRRLDQPRLQCQSDTDVDRDQAGRGRANMARWDLDRHRVGNYLCGGLQENLEASNIKWEEDADTKGPDDDDVYDNDDYVDGDDDNDDYVEVYRQTHSLQSGERTLVCREGRVGGPLGKPGSGIFWCFSFE